MSRDQRAALRPMIVPGPPWQRHRQYLVPDPSVDLPDSFLVLDATTGRQYAWKIWPPGSTSIGVPTTWAHLHRGWTRHTYFLVPAPERTEVTDSVAEPANPGIVARTLGWLRARLA